MARKRKDLIARIYQGLCVKTPCPFCGCLYWYGLGHSRTPDPAVTDCKYQCYDCDRPFVVVLRTFSVGKGDQVIGVRG